MFLNRAPRRFATVVLLATLMIGSGGAAAVLAQDASDNGLGDALGQIFRDVLRGPTDPDRQARAGSSGTGAEATNAQAQRAAPRSRYEMMMSFSPLVKATAPAVVNVYADRLVQRRSSPFAGDPFFEQFFGQRMPNRTERQSSLGSGVIIESRGIVVTNNHVVEGADDIRIALADGREFESRVLLKDERFDLAILAVDGDGPFPAIEFGDTDMIEVGDIVLAIGNPFGVGQTVTSGIVSAVARNRVGVSDFGFFIQTDAAINPGNSGGALVDMDGGLVGINTAIFSRRGGGSIGIGFAIPSEMVQLVVGSAATGAKVRRPWFGGKVQTVTAEIASTLGLSRPVGVLVAALSRDGPASQSGLQIGDVIVAVDGREIADPASFLYRFATRGLSGSANLTVLRNGRERSIDVVLVAAPETRPRDVRMIRAASPFAGAQVANLSPAVAEELRLEDREDGVAIIAIASRSPAARAGFRVGDIIEAVNGTEIDSTRTLDAVAASGARIWRLRVQRGGRTTNMVFSG